MTRSISILFLSVSVCFAQFESLHETALAMAATNQPRLVTNVVVFDPAPRGLGVTNSVLLLGSEWGVVTQRINLGFGTNYVLSTNWSTNLPTPRAISVAYQNTNGQESPSPAFLNWGFPVTNYATVWAQVSPYPGGPFIDVARVIQFTNISHNGVTGPPQQFYRLRVWGWDTNNFGLELAR